MNGPYGVEAMDGKPKGNEGAIIFKRDYCNQSILFNKD
jgi:hypothetical protein